MKSIPALAALLVTLGGVSVASAQDFADQGTFIIAIDRPVGFTHTVRNFDVEGPPDETQTIDSVGLLGTRNVYSPFSAPRASFDYFVIDGLSIGGSLMYWTRSGDVETRTGVAGVSQTNDLNDENMFMIAPRVGYALMFSDAVGWWPRGGFSFFTEGTDVPGGGDASHQGFAFDVDLPFVFVPVEHAAILVGPALDVSFGANGQIDTGPVNVDYDISYFDFGVYAGLGFWL